MRRFLGGAAILNFAALTVPFAGVTKVESTLCPASGLRIAVFGDSQADDL